MHAILYTDGGFEQTYQSGGWAIHGYTYQLVPPKKGAGNPKVNPTSEGYVDKSKAESDVSVTTYIDSFGGVYPANSSNQTELTAATNALKWIVDLCPETVTIYSDSRYVVEGITNYLPRWKNADWKNSKGQTVSNIDLWLTADKLCEIIKSKGIQLNIQWVPGHDGVYGNELADSYARRGNAVARNRSSYTYNAESISDGYWKSVNDYQRLLSSNRLLIGSMDDEYKTDTGAYIYYQSKTEDDDHHGKPLADHVLSVVYLNEKEPVVETIREDIISVSQAREMSSGAIVLVNLTNLFSPGGYKEILTHGTETLRRHKTKLDLHLEVGVLPLAEELSPPGRAFYAVNALGVLKKKLDTYLGSDKETIPRHCIEDITDKFYELSSGKKPTCKLISTINQSTRFVDLYITVPGCENDDPETRTVAKARVLLDKDIPSRNTLSRLADESVIVKLLSWRESESTGRYAIIIETTNGIGIWAGTDSNRVFLNLKPKSKKK